MGDNHWKTAITSVVPNSLMVRGYALDELIGPILRSTAGTAEEPHLELSPDRGLCVS